MNFKILILFFLITACGVKGDPAIPKESSTPSVLHNYEDIELNSPLDEAKKK